MTMNFSAKIAALSLALLCATALPLAAQGVPTVDISSIAKLVEQIAQGKAQLKEMIASNLKLDDQTLKMIQQIKTLEFQLKALTKGLSLADLGINPKTFLKEILPDWDDLTGSMTSARAGDWGSVTKSGKVGGTSVGNYVTGVFEAAGLSKPEVDALASSTDPEAARIGTQANTSAFLSVAGQSSSEQAAESLVRIDGLVQKIPSTGGLKESIDLNTRVTAELGIQLANVWAMEAVQTVGDGAGGVMDAATAAAEEKFLNINGGD